MGAPYYDNGQTDEGKVYVYHGSAAGLSATPDWTREANVANVLFGSSVSTAGDVNGDGYADVIVGGPGFSSAGGRAYVYHGSAAGVDASSGWLAGSGQAGANFGISVSTAGDVDGDGYADVIVGARYYDNGETDEGRAFVYRGSASGLSAVEGWTAESNRANAEFGDCVSTAGDVNGDGYADVIVGAYAYDNGEAEQGAAFVYHGSASGPSATADWTVEGDQADAWFGNSVATAGDVNGDGYTDVIVGAPRYDNVETNEGRAYVYHGSASGLSATPAWIAESNQDGAGFGFRATTAGDVNGDGYADVIIGAWGYSNGESYEGGAFVYHGSAWGLSAAADWTAEGDQAGAYFGEWVSTAGDVNGDGYSDVIVGAEGYTNGEADEGAAFVYHGSASGLSATADWTAESNQGEVYFGYCVSTAGDVNGDGYADVIVGAYAYDNGEAGEGAAYVFHGSASGLSGAPSADPNDAAWMAEGNQAFAYFGESVSTAGDVNGDGYADVIVGADGYDNDQVEEGRVYVYHGSASGLSATEDWMAESNLIAPSFGYSVSTAGDVNGDGYADVIVGAYGYSNGETYEGRAYVYYGNGGPGLSLRPEQRRADDTAPVAHLGRSDSSDGFRVAALGHTPFGRGLVKLQWEVKPLGVPFDGSGTQTSGSWADTGGGGFPFSELVTGLAVETPYHWRLRLLYDTAATPFQQASRWLTVPWNGWQETDLSTRSTAVLGDRVWEDTDGDGIQDAGEPGMANVIVALYDSLGALVDFTVTGWSGGYEFRGLVWGAAYSIRFIPPSGYALTLQDQGGDDALDSDADPVTFETPVFTLLTALDASLWDAGMIPYCVPPDEPIYIYATTLSTDGNDYTILHFMDANQLSQVTGYNVYRSSDPAPPPSTWPQVASDIIDMDQATPNYQWVDTSGDVSPTGIWYYEVTAYNHRCPAEGPF